ncbi:MAG TPA: IclR family transcriptional regulator [Conexibacter sp.]|nr:IclR family transcriptional regulator [Conexibacter sp.]
MSGSEPVQAVQRSLALLDALAERADGGVSELAGATGLQPGTVHRLLTTLVAGGYAAHDPRTRRYRLGSRLLTLATAAERDFARVRAAALPAMHALRDTFGETTNLVVLDRDSIVYVDQVESVRPVRMFSRIGNRVPAHASGAGKALLACEPSEAVDALVARGALPALTANTITIAAVLRTALAVVRRRGYALDEGEYDESVTCAAAAIVLPEGRVPAAISVSGPTERMRSLRLARVGRAVAQAARDAAAAV